MESSLSTNNKALDFKDIPKDWSEITQDGYNYVIFRAWRSIGKFDDNAIENIKQANKAGIENIDIYIFPCIS